MKKSRNVYFVVFFFVIAGVVFFNPPPAYCGNWFLDWKDKIVYYPDLLGKLIFLSDVPPPKGKIDVLIIGLDGRRGQNDRRADAIHCITLWPYEGKIRIISIPRGTMSENIMVGKEIIASSYSTGGKELTITSVEEYLDLKVDYYVIVGFSEAQAIFEKLGYNGEKTLQVLRSRKAYGIGDPQRSHNQAFFMASEIIRNFPYFKEYPTVGRALLFVGHEIVDTNMPFEVMVKISDVYLEKGITKIDLVMKPEHLMSQLKDVKITPETIDSILKDQKEKLEKNEEAQKDIEENKETIEKEPTMSEYLAGLIYYHRRNLGKDDRGIIARTRPKYDQNLWYQVRSDKVSEKLHFEFTELLYQAYFNIGDYKSAREIAQSFMDQRSLDLINLDYKTKIGEMIVRCEDKLYANSSSAP